MGRVCVTAVIVLLAISLSGCAESVWEVSLEERVRVTTRHLRTMPLAEEVVQGVSTAVAALGANSGSELNTTAFAS